MSDISAWVNNCAADPIANFWHYTKALDEQLHTVETCAHLVLGNQVEDMTAGQGFAASRLIEAKRKRIKYLRAQHGVKWGGLVGLIALAVLGVGMASEHTQKSLVLSSLLIAYHSQRFLANLHILYNKQEITVETMQSLVSAFSEARTKTAAREINGLEEYD